MTGQHQPPEAEQNSSARRISRGELAVYSTLAVVSIVAVVLFGFTVVVAVSDITADAIGATTITDVRAAQERAHDDEGAYLTPEELLEHGCLTEPVHPTVTVLTDEERSCYVAAYTRGENKVAYTTSRATEDVIRVGTPPDNVLVCPVPELRGGEEARRH
jgi:hypothetical protein